MVRGRKVRSNSDRGPGQQLTLAIASSKMGAGNPLGSGHCHGTRVPIHRNSAGLHRGESGVAVLLVSWLETGASHDSEIGPVISFVSLSVLIATPLNHYLITDGSFLGTAPYEGVTG